MMEIIMILSIFGVFVGVGYKIYQRYKTEPGYSFLEEMDQKLSDRDFLERHHW